MGKKSSNDVQVIMDTPVEMDTEVLESDAYQNPRPDVNVDATVLKTIGQGGPVPIVAPKRDTIQLQPIVVPLAVVPYMAQDGGSLRTDEVNKKKQVQTKEERDESNQKAINEKVDTIEKRTRINKRVFSAIIFIVAALAAIPFILGHFYQSLWGTNLMELDVIRELAQWIDGVQPYNIAYTITGLISFIAALALCLLSLIGILFGTFPHVLNSILSLLILLPVGAQAIYRAVIKDFVIQGEAFLVAVIALGFITLVLAEIFIYVLNKEEDSIEDLKMDI